MSDSPHSPRRQRKALYTAHTFERRVRMTVPLSRELKARFHRRAVPIRKGDTVRVLGGSYVGREERVAKVNRRDYSVTLDNVTLKMADEKLKPLALRTTNLVITRLNLSDAWRRRHLRVRDEDVTPEERGETPEEEESSEAPAPTPADAPAEPDDSASEADDDATEPETASDSPAPAKAPARARSKPSATEGE
jgi:ribosomal protein uL24